MTKFTPGPWSIRKSLDNSENWDIIAPNSGYICELGSNWNNNANLIAAAPEIYDALEILTDTISSITGENTVEKYRKLLAKARGEV